MVYCPSYCNKHLYTEPKLVRCPRGRKDGGVCKDVKKDPVIVQPGPVCSICLEEQLQRKGVLWIEEDLRLKGLECTQKAIEAMRQWKDFCESHPRHGGASPQRQIEAPKNIAPSRLIPPERQIEAAKPISPQAKHSKLVTWGPSITGHQYWPS